MFQLVFGGIWPISYSSNLSNPSRDHVLTHLALLRSVLQAWCGHRWPSVGFGAWCAPQGLVFGSACPRLRFRPETPLAGSPVRSHCHDPFCRGHGSKECVAQPTPNGPTARHNLAAGNARGTGIKASEAVPEFTANAFADHHRRIRLAAHCEPKTMNSRRGSGGMPSTTLHFASNDKATARDFAP